MNDIVKHLQSHRSIRKFKPDTISEEQLGQIMASAQAASTSSNIQAYSVIGVRDTSKKRDLAKLAGGQRHVEECPLFLVWCADLHRAQVAVRMHTSDIELELHQNVETFLVATVDAALAAQNAAVAAEALGLGTVFIGGIRNDMQQVVDLLHLPRLVYPVFGMCIGISDQMPTKRPRLPVQSVYHDERYSDSGFASDIHAYDETLGQYYASRTGEGKQASWSGEMEARLRQNRLRPELYAVIKSQGFCFQ
ncbi:oxygen-insensitive NADPH nitroreductase [Paenibacillus sp. Leaf72]|uniref:oxygen-insensitive NADPH nitroreductase n=1 Tax=Paenibacillus sp. Leaf72 TaxID=1736234 RepID=UPI0006F8DF55|nr:oxygen-insensitive NADPH nitroreductase [Paenibacillus sp. Leaf72]KQO18451.1 NADPH-dependent oxidoreductase [Paenibacillus sp. Leaf72]